MAGQSKFKPMLDRILSKCVVSDDGCLIWTGHTTPGGYGKIRARGTRLFIHRLAYELMVGEIRDGLCVCHKCDNPRCVNIDHLFLGTRADNNADKVRKNRQSRGSAHSMPGERHPLAKLSVSQVMAIRETTGKTQRQVAEEYGVSQSIVSRIITNKNWR